MSYRKLTGSGHLHSGELMFDAMSLGHEVATKVTCTSFSTPNSMSLGPTIDGVTYFSIRWPRLYWSMKYYLWRKLVCLRIGQSKRVQSPRTNKDLICV